MTGTKTLLITDTNNEQTAKISLSDFGELVSSYLDNEADNDEIRLISECVRTREDCRELLAKMQKIHIYALKVCGKKPKKMRGYDKVAIEFQKGKIGYTKMRERLELFGIACVGAAASILIIIALV